MSGNLREYYKALYLSGMCASPHGYGYSGKLAGAMYAISEIRDAVPVIHGSAGCGFHYKYICRRGYLPAYNAQCTGLEEKDIVFGGADRLRATVLETAERFAPAMIAVIPAASVDMIHDDVENVLEALRGRVACRLLSVKSEKFSHADKRDGGRLLEQWARNRDNHDFKSEADFKGCGFVEAMKAMVEQVMEKQAVRKNSVNICGLAWGAGGSALAEGMASELKELGIHVNAFLPNCTTKEIIEAPKAELNIITRRIRWAERMEEVFGTGYFHLNSFDFYRGPDGIERLYLKISERLGMRGNTDKILRERKRRALEALKPVKEYFKGFRFALFTSSYRDAPCLIEKYETDFGIPLRAVCVEMNRESLELDGISGDTADIMVENMRRALAKTGSRAQLLINASPGILEEALGEADFVIGGEELVCKPGGARCVPGAGNLTPMDFEGFVKMASGFAQRLEKAPVPGGLLIERFRYSRGHYPMLDNPNMSGSREMWERMWLRGGCGA